MNKKKIILLSAIAFLTVVLVFQLVSQSKTGIKVLTLSDNADTLVIEQPKDDSIVLTKNGDEWRANDTIIVDDAKLSPLMDAVASIKILGTVGSIKDSSKFGLDDETSITITAKLGEKSLRVLKIGKKSAVSTQSYAQIDESGDVYLISGIPGSNFPLTAIELEKNEEPPADEGVVEDNSSEVE